MCSALAYERGWVQRIPLHPTALRAFAFFLSLVGVMASTTKQCGACGDAKEKEGFSSKQWHAKKIRRCKDCVESGNALADNARPPPPSQLGDTDGVQVASPPLPPAPPLPAAAEEEHECDFCHARGFGFRPCQSKWYCHDNCQVRPGHNQYDHSSRVRPFVPLSDSVRYSSTLCAAPLICHSPLCPSTAQRADFPSRSRDYQTHPDDRDGGVPTKTTKGKPKSKSKSSGPGTAAAIFGMIDGAMAPTSRQLITDLHHTSDRDSCADADRGARRYELSSVSRGRVVPGPHPGCCPATT